jgi:hypothetical protein
VSSYTHRGLTNPDDRAIAILGLAQYLSRSSLGGSGPGYLAGLWKQDLAKSLLWYVRLGLETRPLTTRAPTWSWLSVQGGIVNNSVGLDPTTAGVEIEFVQEIQPERPTSLERPELYNVAPTLAKGSFIQLKGKVRPLTRLELPQHPDYFYNSCTDISVDRYPELRSNAVLAALSIASEKRIGPRCYPLSLAGPGVAPCVGWYIPDTTDEIALPVTLHCLCITVEPSNEQSKEDFTQPWATRGLALRLIDDPDMPSSSSGAISTYERIGYFELEWRSIGAYVTYDTNYFQELKYHPRRVPPEIDPHGVFKDCGSRTLRLY